MAATTTVTITMDVPTLWWAHLVAQLGSEDEARAYLLKNGGVHLRWREQLARFHAERTGTDLAELDAAKEAAVDAELAKLQAKPDKKKPGPPPAEPPAEPPPE
jgi:beta-phosphoglucomutase-like phosphatase (HAD superfamily)